MLCFLSHVPSLMLLCEQNGQAMTYEWAAVCLCTVPAGQVIVLLMSQSSHMTPGEALPPSHTHKCHQVMMYATIGGQPDLFWSGDKKCFTLFVLRRVKSSFLLHLLWRGDRGFRTLPHSMTLMDGDKKVRASSLARLLVEKIWWSIMCCLTPHVLVPRPYKERKVA